MSLTRLGWLIVPLTVLAGDFAVRWGTGLPPNVTQSPSNLFASMSLSLVLWWAVSRLVGTSQWRWLWAALVAVPMAWLTVSLWQYNLTTGQDPNWTLVVYMWQEPESSARMMGSRLTLTTVVAAVGLSALWTAALACWRGQLSNVIKRACVLGPAFFVFAALAWPMGVTVGQTPFAGDFHAARTVLFGAKQIVSGGAQQTLGFAGRVHVDEVDERVDGPNLVVFVAESLRRDRLPMFGHDRETTPALSRLAAERGDQLYPFERALSTAPSTNLSLTAILLGLYPAHPKEPMHRAPTLWHYAKAIDAQTFLVSPQDWTWQNMNDFLVADSPIDHVLTASTTGAPIVNDVGADDRLFAEALDELLTDTIDDQRPFVGLVQNNATHFPYLMSEDIDWELKTSRDRYDAAVAEGDHMFGQMVDALERRDMLDDTVIIFVSDHADFFYEGLGEAQADPAGEDGPRPSSCHPATMSIPMFIFLPTRWAERLAIDTDQLRSHRERVVSTVDVLPTALSLWGLQRQDGPNLPALDGYNLFEPLPADRTAMCFNTMHWNMLSVTGFSVIGSERIVYGRKDLGRYLAFDPNDERIWEQRQGGRELTDEDKEWIRAAVDGEPLLAPYVEHLSGKSSP